MKYTVYGSEELDNNIDNCMKKISKSMMQKLPHNEIAAIILGGGYGRGEGGFVIENGTEHLYNDFDMFILANNISRKRKRELTPIILEISEELTKEIGIDVDFSPIQNISTLEKAPYWMMWYDLKMGHQVILGDKNILNKLPNWKAEDMPMIEGLRLVLNRGAGLFQAGIKFRGDNLSEVDLRHLEKDISKAFMACGDMFLIAHKNFTHSYVGKIEAINKFKHVDIITDDDFVTHHIASINYKLKPDRADINQDSLKELYDKILLLYRKFWLFGFSILLDQKIENFVTCNRLLLSHGYKEPDDNSLLKNIVLNIKEIGMKN
ncbi:MAG: hypothetical protein GQ534_11185, partial [Candidatus Delongbacteria bacterium]|nr:hypothetical protein [Candidatus Delongbacteria bacterium]